MRIVKKEYRTPITYYGGKQNLAKWVISHFPKHQQYIEPFAGGLAVFFARRFPKKIEVINDINSEVYNFYLQWRENPKELIRVLEATPYSLEDFKNCRSIFQGKIKASNIERARAFFVVNHCSFAAAAHSWGRVTSHLKMGGPSGERLIKKVSSLHLIKDRLRRVYIENQCALKVIKTYDNKDSLFYCDPPYPETDQNEYRGYTMKDFNNLLKVLETIEGKFILSCYLKDGMKIDSKFRIEHREMICTLPEKGDKKSKRQETLIMNF